MPQHDVTGTGRIKAQSRGKTHRTSGTRGPADAHLTDVDGAGESEAFVGPYVIAMPVPNITGSLHIGHALNLVIQDAFARHTMGTGRAVSFLPGVGHAGLAGQLAAERILRTRGLTRRCSGHDRFMEAMQCWHDENQADLLRQMRALGLSAAWDDAVSSIDARRRELVQQAFVDLWERRLIYRDECLVNWCIDCETCIPEEEIERQEVYRTAYRITVLDEAGAPHIAVTPDPHLILAATGVRVPAGHPAAASATLELPIAERRVPVRVVPETSPHLSSAELSLVLPSCDAEDFNLVRGEGRSVVAFYHSDGTVNAGLEPFDGLTDDDCRELVIAELLWNDRLESQRTRLDSQPVHRLCEGKVVPRPTTQWFLRREGLQAFAADLHDAAVTRFNNPRWHDRYQEALGMIRDATQDPPAWWERAGLDFERGFSSNRDWLLSRQNWWGIPVPAFHCDRCTTIEIEWTDDAPPCPVCRVPMEPSSDVLDVLVHGALWAYCVTPDPNRSPHADLAVIGHDILEFWIPTANVLAAALYDVVSIRDVFVHGVICDEHGRKMSTSLGNTTSLDEVLGGTDTEAVRSLMFNLAGRAASVDLVPMTPEATREANGFIQGLRVWLAEVEVIADDRTGAERDDELGRIEGTDARDGSEAWDSKIDLTGIHRLVRTAMGRLDVGEAYRLVRTACEAMQTFPVLYDSELAAFAQLLEPFHPLIARNALARRTSGRHHG